MDIQMGLLAALIILLYTHTSVCGAEGCTRFSHLENGQTFFRYRGLLVIFRCNPGYRLHGYKTNSCASGQWSRDIPVCVGSGCSYPGPLTHGTSSMTENGSWAVFSCNSGFRLHGPSVLYCKGHTWNSTKPVCRELDMMSSASGVSVDKPYVRQNLHAAVVLKTHQQSLSDVYAKSTSREANLKFDSLAHTPPQMSRDERIKMTEDKNDAQTTGRNGSEAKLSSEEPEKVDKVSQTFASILHAVSPTSTLVSETELSTSSPLSFSTARTSPIPYVVSRPMASKHPPQTSKLRFGAPVPTRDDAPSSEVATDLSSQTVYDDKQAESGFLDPVLSQPRFVDKEEPRETLPYTLSVSVDFSSTSSSSSPAPVSSTVPLSASFPSPGPKSLSTEHNIPVQMNTTSRPPLVSPRRGRRPVCPYPPVPAHGTFYYRNVKNPGPREYRHYIQYSCYPGYTLAHGDKHSYCQRGGTWSGITPFCLELIPCSVNKGGCSQLCSHYQHYDQSSSQTHNTTQCHCTPGFTLMDDRRTCQDIDECAVNEGLGPCTQQCHNFPGSYRCSCAYGHTLAADGHHCISECPPGYEKQPTTTSSDKSTARGPREEECVDRNECQKGTPCEWQCVNMPGSHRCVCPRGYKLQPDGRHCKDINECSRRNGGCSHLCVNQKGGHKCACPASHRLSPYSWKKCVQRSGQQWKK